MSRLARALCSLHGTAFLWLGYCTVQSARNNAALPALLFTAASALSVLAVVRECELADQQWAVAVRAEREARLRAWADEDTAVLARTELADDCCELWWTSMEAEHADDCPKNDRRSTA
ncbi:hypothetical protein ACIBKX_36965 [Streptomyces sp. NPDC050658]|uniref:hypothetical protein n=1 Tax=unclassified Streptomyces TaxID=2593676 RepID=UPI00342F6231